MGVLGCAGIALRRMVPAMVASPAVTLVALASRSADKADRAAARFGCAAVTGYSALLDRDDIDAVYVPLPLALHAEWVGAALSAGRHVLAEKPLTGDPDRTAELVAQASAAGLVLRENVLFVHHAQHAAVRDWVAAGEIGRLQGLHATFGIPALPDDDIRYDAALGGGALFDVGLYPVRAAMHLLGPDLTVVGATAARGPGRGVDTAGTALLVRPDGVTVQLSYGLDHGYRSSYELWGSTGRIVVDRAFTPPADHRPRIRVERVGAAEDRFLPADDQVANAITAFAADVRAGSAADGLILRQSRLLDALRQLAGSRVLV
jgi:predicted dehydrogenase